MITDSRASQDASKLATWLVALLAGLDEDSRHRTFTQLLAHLRSNYEDATLPWSGDLQDDLVDFEQPIAEEARQYQYLVRRLIVDIRYGCKNPACSTPTCYSRQRQLAAVPLRRPTFLTARMIAFTIASEPGAWRRLCPNEPRLSVEDLEKEFERAASNPKSGSEKIHMLARIHMAPKASDVMSDSPVTDMVGTDVSQNAGQEGFKTKDRFRSHTAKHKGAGSRHYHDSALLDYVERTKRPDKKDRRSLAQNLFDSNAVKQFEWEKIPRSLILNPPAQCENKTEAVGNGDRTDHKRATLRTSCAIPDRPLAAFGKLYERPIDASGKCILTPLNEDTILWLQDLLSFVKTNERPPPNLPESQHGIPFHVGAHINQCIQHSLRYNLEHPDRLLASFGRGEFTRQQRPWDFRTQKERDRLLKAFGNWQPSIGNCIIVSLTRVLNTLSDILAKESPRSAQITNPMSTSRTTDLDDRLQVAFRIGLTSVIAMLWDARSIDWRGVVEHRKNGNPIPLLVSGSNNEESIRVADALEYEPATRLITQLLNIIASCQIQELIKRVNATSTKYTLPPSQIGVNSWLDQYLVTQLSYLDGFALSSIGAAAIFMEHIRTIIQRNWDGKPEIYRWDTIGVALATLANLYDQREDLQLHADDFVMPWMFRSLDVIKTVRGFLSSQFDQNRTHILYMPWLLPRRERCLYFRAINYQRLCEGYQSGSYQTVLTGRVSIGADMQWSRYLQCRLRPALSRCLTLEVNRETLLEDTFDQLWRRERRELFRPFKVLIGGEFLEMGDDHGGPTREFFRFVFEEAFQPEYGLFTIDDASRMPWFNPASREPAATYEMLGLLLSLAVYNGISAPVNFPLALYAYILGKDSAWGIDDLQDGWPDLHASFRTLLSWHGDVEKDLMREYAFTIRDADTLFHVNMKVAGTVEEYPLEECLTTASVALPPAPLVTNADAVEFVADYSSWLIYKSVRPKLEAFRKGFMTCLDAKSLTMLGPALLRMTTEGQPDIDFAAIRRIATYENGFHADHPLVVSLWKIIDGYGLARKKALLEFVTASDRVPVTGVDSMMFVIERSGEDTEHLPSSQTCFSTLKLPEYDSEETLRSKLGIVLDFGAIGFGTA